jgi:hypothetical protein
MGSSRTLKISYEKSQSLWLRVPHELQEGSSRTLREIRTWFTFIVRSGPGLNGRDTQITTSMLRSGGFHRTQKDQQEVTDLLGYQVRQSNKNCPIISGKIPRSELSRILGGASARTAIPTRAVQAG